MRLSLTTAPKINPQLILIMLHHYCFHGTDHSLKLHLYFFRCQLSSFQSFLRVGILPNLLATVSPCPGPSHTQRTLLVEWMNGLVQATFLWEPQCPELFRAWSGLSHRAMGRTGQAWGWRAPCSALGRELALRASLYPCPAGSLWGDLGAEPESLG